MNPGDEVEVQLERHDEPRRARVIRVPPYTETVAGEEVERTDEVLVEYLGTGRGVYFGNIREAVPEEAIR